MCQLSEHVEQVSSSILTIAGNELLEIGRLLPLFCNVFRNFWRRIYESSSQYMYCYQVEGTWRLPLTLKGGSSMKQGLSWSIEAILSRTMPYHRKIASDESSRNR